MAPSRGAYAPAAASEGAECGPLVLENSRQCSLRLQVLLYFSFWYDVLFAFLMVLAAWVKWRWLKGEIIYAFMGGNFFVIFVLEPWRLYLGYAGNLRERVPELFLFVFVCFVCYATFAAQLVLTTEIPELSPEWCSTIPGQPCVLPIEKACYMGRVVLALAEQILGVGALRRLIKEQSARFFVSLEASVGSAAMGGGANGDDLDITALMDNPGSSSGAAAGRSGAGTREGSQPRPTSAAGTALNTRGSVAGSTTPQVYGRQLFSPAGQHDGRPHLD